MATIDNRPLKAYVRFDGTGRIVPSSLILRRKKPKVGKWVEIPAYECCNPTTTTTTTVAPGTELFYTPESYPIINIQFVLLCNDVFVFTEYIYEEVNNATELAASLNNNPTNQLGYFVAQPDGSIKLTVPDSVKEEYCPTGTMSFFAIAS